MDGKQFKILNAVLKENSELNISLLFKIEPVQSLSEGGLTFTLIVVNDSTQNIRVLNPLDYLTINIQDEEGWPIILPVYKSRLQINASGPINIERPYLVKAIENNLGEPNLIEQAGAKDIELKAGVTYTYTICLDKVQDSDKKNPVRTEKSMPFMKGKYKINLLISLMLSDDGSLYKQSETGYEEVEII